MSHSPQQKRILIVLLMIFTGGIFASLTSPVSAASFPTLALGSHSQAVSDLQRVLSTDPALYPEGSITGYYGKATEVAVKRFQTKYNIVSSGTPATTGYGKVGKKTALKLEKIYGSSLHPVRVGSAPNSVVAVPPSANPFLNHTVSPHNTSTDSFLNPGGANNVDVKVDAQKILGQMPPSLFGVNAEPWPIPVEISNMASLLNKDDMLKNSFIRLWPRFEIDLSWGPRLDVENAIKTVTAQRGIPLVVMFAVPPSLSSKCEISSSVQRQGYVQIGYYEQTFYCYKPGLADWLNDYAAFPPKDYQAWTNFITEQTRRFRSLGVQYYEIWNEPEYTGVGWSGTDEEFFKTIEASIRGIKAGDPDAKIVVDGAAGPPSETMNQSGRNSGLTLENILARLKRDFPNDTPVDMVSWHMYGTYTAARLQAEKDTMLSIFGKYGYPLTIPMIVDEWNNNLDQNNPSNDNSEHAAYIASYVKAYIDIGILHAYHALGDLFADSNFLGTYRLTTNGIAKPSYNAFRALKKLDDTRIAATQSNDIYVTTIATKSSISNQTSVLLSNFKNITDNLALAQTVNLTINNLTPGTYTLSRYLIDKDHSNSCRLNKKTEPSPTTTECGQGGIIDQKVKDSKDTALSQGKQIFTSVLQQKGYANAEIAVATNYVEKYVANLNDPSVQTWLHGLSAKQKQDVIDAFNTAQFQYNKTFQQGIDAINTMDKVKLDIVETRTITIADSSYQATLQMEPYSVMVLQLVPN